MRRRGEAIKLCQEIRGSPAGDGVDFGPQRNDTVWSRNPSCMTYTEPHATRPNRQLDHIYIHTRLHKYIATDQWIRWKATGSMTGFVSRRRWEWRRSSLEHRTGFLSERLSGIFLTEANATAADHASASTAKVLGTAQLPPNSPYLCPRPWLGDQTRWPHDGTWIHHEPR
jgi:hypothetical protein